MTDRTDTRRSFMKTASAVAAGVYAAATGRDAFAALAPDPRAANVASLRRWVTDMVALGPRITGGKAHRRWIDYLEAELKAFGLQPRRYGTPLRYWEARRWSLRVADAAGVEHDLPVAFYLPYAGETGPHGVTGEIVDVGQGLEKDYDAASVAGKIVLFDRVHQAEPVASASVRPVIATYPRYLALDRLSFVRPFFSSAGGIGPQGARQRGAVAAIDILDFPAAVANGQFSPHQQHSGGVPTLTLDRDQGARLRALLKTGPVTATLVLEADRDDDATIDYLVAKLPGVGTLPGAICLLTHTDGQNAVEENGAAALLSIARRFADLPIAQRPRDVYFVFSAAHMKAHDEGGEPMAWLETQPAIKAAIKAVFTIEHLGAMEWAYDPKRHTYGPSGREELWIMATGHSDRLTAIAAEELDKSSFSRVALTGPPGDLYGEGTSTYRAGIPSITTACGPSYLLQISRDGGLHQLSFPLMSAQVDYCARVASRMLWSNTFE